MVYFLTKSSIQSNSIKLEMDFTLKSWADKENSMSSILWISLLGKDMCAAKVSSVKIRSFRYFLKSSSSFFMASKSAGIESLKCSLTQIIN